MKPTILAILLLCGVSQWIHAQTQVTFRVAEIPIGEAAFVGIRGDTEPLSWYESMKMEKRGDTYYLPVTFPAGTHDIEFKFVLFDEKGEPIWENIDNRTLQFKEEREVSYSGNWNEEPYIDPSNLSRLSSEQLLADYKLIERMLLDVHPGTYRYNEEATIKDALATLKEKFQQEQTYGAAYLAISKLLASIQCDHTFASFYNQNALIKSVIHRQRDKLPFTFRWIAGKMIVIYDASEAQLLKRGTEIEAINGIPVADIKEKMLAYISSDGGGAGSRIAKTELYGYDFRYDAFDVLHPLLFPLTGENFELSIRAFEAMDSEAMTVKATTRKERNRLLGLRYPSFPKTRDDLLSFRMTDDNIGILKLGSFGLMGWKSLSLDYKAFFADAFAQLAKNKAQHLIIDIRESVGGSDEMKDELVTYFNVDRVINEDREGRTRYLQFPEALKPFVQSWGDEPWYYALKREEATQKDGYYIFRKTYYRNQRNKKKKHVFKGKAYLLTSAQNASLSYYLAQDFRKFKVGQLIGQETDGNLQGINGGQILFLRLPNSTIEIDFPVMGDFVDGEQPNHGVIPDILVEPTVSDIYQGIDTELETAFKVIKTNN